MSTAPDASRLCPWPDCQRPLEGIGVYCWQCGRYAADFTRQNEQKTKLTARDGKSEKQIQAEVKKALKALGFQVWDLSQPRATKQTEGLADLFAAGRGLTVWIEVKSSAGKQTESQRRFERFVKANGGRYVLARGAKDVEKLLTA